MDYYKQKIEELLQRCKKHLLEENGKFSSQLQAEEMYQNHLVRRIIIIIIIVTIITIITVIIIIIIVIIIIIIIIVIITTIIIICLSV